MSDPLILEELPEDPADLAEALLKRRDELKALVGDERYQRRIGEWKDVLLGLNRHCGEETMTLTAINAATDLVRSGHGHASNWVLAACVELATEATSHA